MDILCDMVVNICKRRKKIDELRKNQAIVVNSNDDDTSSDDDDFKDIEYVEASPPDLEIVSLEEVNDVDQEKEEFDLENILQIQDVILREKLLNINRLIANIESLNDNSTPNCCAQFFFSISSPIVTLSLRSPILLSLIGFLSEFGIESIRVGIDLALIWRYSWETSVSCAMCYPPSHLMLDSDFIYELFTLFNISDLPSSLLSSGMYEVCSSDLVAVRGGQGMSKGQYRWCGGLDQSEHASAPQRVDSRVPDVSVFEVSCGDLMNNEAGGGEQKDYNYSEFALRRVKWHERNKNNPSHWRL
ncbi:hypothetical protein Tco_0097714 [Tanacetum coccineum]